MKKVVFLLVFLAFAMGCRSQGSMNTIIKPDVIFSPAPTLGIMALTSNPPECGAAISDAIGSGLVTSDFTVIERVLLNELQHKVDYVLMGSATIIEKDSYGGTKWKRSATQYTMVISASVRIVDVSNGTIVATIMYTVPKNLWLYPDLIGNKISKEVAKLFKSSLKIEKIIKRVQDETKGKLIREYDIAGETAAITEGEARYLFAYNSPQSFRDRMLREGFEPVYPGGGINTAKQKDASIHTSATCSPKKVTGGMEL